MQCNVLIMSMSALGDNNEKEHFYLNWSRRGRINRECSIVMDFELGLEW